MSIPPWVEQLHHELRVRGLPRATIDRLTVELLDHAQDLCEESHMDATSLELSNRLGSPQEIARLAQFEYRRASFVGRHPVVVFLIAPIPLAIGCLALLGVGLVGLCTAINYVGKTMGAESESLRSAFSEVMRWAPAFFNYVPFALTAAFLGWWGRRGGRLTWALLGCAMVAVLAALFHMNTTLTPVGKGGSLSIGFGLSQTSLAVGQFLVPLLVGGIIMTMPSRSKASPTVHPTVV